LTTRTILLMAAGTGGHVFPGIAIAKVLGARGWARGLDGHAHRHGEQAGGRGRLSDDGRST
jgi:UDP-N-acetylglucosamine:LPS N-acetylglucosamine transferase